jgi:hypothetical protein
MKSLFAYVVVFILLNKVSAQSNIPSPEIQIKMAVLAAPEEMRAGAMVYGYDAKGKLTVLRKGTNEMVCLGDNPAVKGFNAACYHKDLEPYMARGRELRAAGIAEDKTVKMRDDEVKTGKLKMTSKQASLYALSAEDADCDYVNGTVKNGYLRSVIYIPYATTASTGLPTKPAAPGMPWIMYPGTPRAHIMINPPATTKK